MSNPRYPPPDYKDSGVPWLGKIPAGWDVRRLKFCVLVTTTKLGEKPNDLPFLGLENIESKTGRLILETPVEQVESTVNIFEPGDVLFGKLRPYLAKAALVDFVGACTTELLVLRPNPNAEGKYIFYFILSDGFIKIVSSMTYGAKMPRASSEQIGNISMPLPPLAQQRAIASYLDEETTKLDRLIAKVQQGIALLREYRTALISAAVTGKIDVGEHP